MYSFAHPVFRATLLCASILGLASPASAGRRIPAMSGIAQRPTESTCFSNGNGNITNSSCAGLRRFCLPLSWDYNAFGNFANVSIAAKTPANTTLSCFTMTTSSIGNSAGFSGVRTIPNDNLWHVVSMSGGGIPDQGGVYSCCDLPQGGSISVVNY